MIGRYTGIGCITLVIVLTGISLAAKAGLMPDKTFIILFLITASLLATIPIIIRITLMND